MSHSEFLEWQAFYELEPFGAERDNFHSATIAHILANQWRDKGKREIPFSRFVYVDPATKRKQKDELLLARMRKRKLNG